MATKKDKETEQKSQIKSKKRVADHGEVFTNEREVNAMLDLVKQEASRIDSRFLEPACGTGNFLTVILSRKLQAVNKNYSKVFPRYEANALLAIGSIYGVDIQEDNVLETRQILLEQFKKDYNSVAKKNKMKTNEEVIKSAEFILSKNILWADALTMKMQAPELNGSPIIFSEWSLVMNNFQRREFFFNELVNTYSETEQKGKKKQADLFKENSITNDLGEEAEVFTPKQNYELINYRLIYTMEN